MMQKFSRFSHQRMFWVLLILFGVGLEVAALYYQYVLNELPCVLCIHVRMWVAAVILVGMGGLITCSVLKSPAKAYVNRFWHVLNVVIAIGLLERCYKVLAVERGWTLDSCGMGLGLPEWLTWLAVDEWMPWLFEATGACGYTPAVLFLTMAEALMVISVVFLLVSMLLMVLSWRSVRD